MKTLRIDADGELYRHASFPSRYVQPRHVDVWCPPGYAASRAVRYPVIYMHDGQNLFDPAVSNLGIDWGVDEALVRLIGAGQVAGAIVVGIWNTPIRWREYMPQQALAQPRGHALRAQFIAQQGGPPVSNHYLRFLVRELKPFIDASYRTLPEQVCTVVMGSSMGGLISLYALVSYPQVFGAAGCISTHWPGGEDVVLEYLGRKLPRPGVHRLYFDFGTETLDADYEPYQLRMDAILQQAGYTRGRDWVTHKFAGADHSEHAWRARLDVPLRFLLAP